VRLVLQARRLTCAAAYGVKIGLLFAPYNLHRDPILRGVVSRAYGMGSDMWVWFGDLPDTTRNALWEKHKSKLAFPAGLFGSQGT
jgi:hypothetical protein